MVEQSPDAVVGNGQQNGVMVGGGVDVGLTGGLMAVKERLEEMLAVEVGMVQQGKKQ